MRRDIGSWIGGVGRAVAAELVKTVSIPVVVISALTVVGGVLAGLAVGRSEGTAPGLGLAAAMGQVGVIVLGATVGAAEFRRGHLGLSLLAVPRRGRFVLAALVTLTTTCAVVAACTVAATVVASGGSTDPDVPRTVLGAWAYLTGMGVLAWTWAICARNALVPLGVLGVLTSGGSTLLMSVSPTMARIVAFLPDQAGGHLLPRGGAGLLVAVSGQPPGALGPVAGALVLLAWLVVSATAAGWAVRVRDA